MTIKKFFAFLFNFDKIDNFDNELQGAHDWKSFFFKHNSQTFWKQVKNLESFLSNLELL